MKGVNFGLNSEGLIKVLILEIGQGELSEKKEWHGQNKDRQVFQEE